MIYDKPRPALVSGEWFWTDDPTKVVFNPDNPDKIHDPDVTAIADGGYSTVYEVEVTGLWNGWAEFRATFEVTKQIVADDASWKDDGMDGVERLMWGSDNPQPGDPYLIVPPPDWKDQGWQSGESTKITPDADGMYHFRLGWVWEVAKYLDERPQRTEAQLAKFRKLREGMPSGVSLVHDVSHANGDDEFRTIRWKEVGTGEWSGPEPAPYDRVIIHRCGRHDILGAIA